MAKLLPKALAGKSLELMCTDGRAVIEFKALCSESVETGEFCWIPLGMDEEGYGLFDG